jgi:hypothetical protein
MLMRRLLLVTAVSVCLAAIPPLPTELRKSYSDIIVQGLVGPFQSAIVDRNGVLLQDQSEERGQDTKYKVNTFSFLVEDAEKGHVEEGDIRTLAYRKILLPARFVGPQGQNGDLSEGDRVKVFAASTPKGVSEFASSEADFILLEPNGWESVEDTDAGAGTSLPYGSPPRLVHSRRHGFIPDKPLRLTRAVSKGECPWLEKDLEAGAIVHLYTGYTYGTVDFRSGIAVTLAPGLDESFVELPASALEQQE